MAEKEGDSVNFLWPSKKNLALLPILKILTPQQRLYSILWTFKRKFWDFKTFITLCV